MVSQGGSLQKRKRFKTNPLQTPNNVHYRNQQSVQTQQKNTIIAQPPRCADSHSSHFSDYRDITMMDGTYPVGVIDRGVPGSDCAVEVVVIEMRQFTDFNKNVLLHMPRYSSWEEVLFLSFDLRFGRFCHFQQAESIICAGITAWNALDMLETRAPLCYKVSRIPMIPNQANQGQYLESAGVSMLSLLICLGAPVSDL
jgi:hypothetical protein